ncbi:MAG: hypothetical protein H0T79_24140 [Deltaproteobacteria bacterium]|nr:hypothetical protein [Deltaproteobacteria bacterium]
MLLATRGREDAMSHVADGRGGDELGGHDRALGDHQSTTLLVPELECLLVDRTPLVGNCLERFECEQDGSVREQVLHERRARLATHEGRLADRVDSGIGDERRHASRQVRAPGRRNRTLDRRDRASATHNTPCELSDRGRDAARYDREGEHRSCTHEHGAQVGIGDRLRGLVEESLVEPVHLDDLLELHACRIELGLSRYAVLELPREVATRAGRQRVVLGVDPRGSMSEQVVDLLELEDRSVEIERHHPDVHRERVGDRCDHAFVSSSDRLAE